MTANEYAVWTKFHRDLFQMKSAEDGPMFTAWMPSMLEFAIPEAKAASLEIASSADTAGRFRTEHLALVRRFIRAKRFARDRAEAEAFSAQHDRDSCQGCGGGGLIGVPDPRSVRDDAWTHPFYELAVACRCNVGIRIFNTAKNREGEIKAKTGFLRRTLIIDIDQYEQWHPDWRDMVAARDAQRKSESAARWHAEKADREQPLNVKQAIATIGAEK